MMPHMPGLVPILVIVFLMLILFGPSRLPEAARSLGSAHKEFKKGLREDPEPDPPALPPSGDPNCHP